MSLQKAYTAGVGFAFLVIVGFTLVADTAAKGVSLESVHKLTHIVVGAWAAVILIKKHDQHVAFALFNGFFYGAFAVVGWLVPDFLGIDAFNRADTVLHSLVAGAGLLVGFLGLKK